MSNEEVRFRLGFEDSPESIAQLEKLAANVEETQRRISSSISQIGAAAAAAAQVAGSGGGQEEQAAFSAAAAAEWAGAWTAAREEDIAGFRAHASALDAVMRMEVQSVHNVSDAVTQAMVIVEDHIDELRSEAARPVELDFSIAGDEEIAEMLNKLDELDKVKRDATNFDGLDAGTSGKAYPIDQAREMVNVQRELGVAYKESTLKLEESSISAARALAGVISSVAMVGASQTEEIQQAIRMLMVVQGSVNFLASTMDSAKTLAEASRDYANLRSLAIQSGGSVIGSAGERRVASAAGGIAGDVAGGVAGGAAASAAGGTGMVVGGGAAVTFAAGVAALGGVVAGLTSAVKSVQDVADNGLFGGAEVGGWSDTIASWEVAVADWIGDVTGFFNIVNDELVAEAEARRQSVALENEIIRARKQIATEVEAQTRAAQRGVDDRAAAFNSVSMSDEERLAQMRLRDEKEGNIAAGLRAQLPDDSSLWRADDGTMAIANELMAIDDQRLGAQTEMLALSKQIADTQKEGARSAVESLQQELQMREDERRTIEESLMTAKERFAAMSELEQRQAIAAKAKADQGGVMSLNDQERALLRRVGTGDATRAARVADVAEADRAGFDRFFGRAERAALVENRNEQQKITADIVDKREFIAKVEFDAEQIAKKLSETVSALMDSQEQIISQKAEADLRERQYQAALTARANSASRRSAASD